MLRFSISGDIFSVFLDNLSEVGRGEVFDVKFNLFHFQVSQNET